MTTAKQSTPASTDRLARLPFAVLAVVYALSALLPLPASDGRILGIPSICPFNELTGLPCPGCGLTRAFVCIAHGRFAEAVHWHALSPVLFVAGLILLVDSGRRVFAGRPLLPRSHSWQFRAGWTGAAVFLLYGLGRIAYFAVNHHRF